MSKKKIDIRGFLEGKKVNIWTSKEKKRQAVREYFASFIEINKYYSESEIDELLNKFHTFGDPALLRRELFDKGYIQRNKNDSKYWKDKQKEPSEIENERMK